MADSIRDALVLEDESKPEVKQEEEKEKKNELTSVIKIESGMDSGPTDGPPSEQEAMPTESAAKSASTETKEGVPTTEPGNASAMGKTEPIPQLEIRGRLCQQLEKVHSESPSMQGEVNELRRILLQWEDYKKNPEILHTQAYMYSLENYCDETPFAIAKSSETDKAVIDRLEAACSHKDFYLYFAHVERRVESLRIDDYDIPRLKDYRCGGYGYLDDDDGLDEEEDYDQEEEYGEPNVTLILTHLTDRNGSGPFHGFELCYDDSDLQFINEENFEDEEPEDGDFDGGAKTEIYTRTVAIVIPRAFRSQFFLDENQDNVEDNILKLLLPYCKAPATYADDADLLAVVEESCKMAIERISWESLSSPHFSERVSKLAVVAIAYLGNKNLFEQALPLAFSIAANSEVKTAITGVVKRHGRNWLFSTLNKQVAQLATLHGRIDTSQLISSVLQTDEWQFEKYGVNVTSRRTKETDVKGKPAVEPPGRDPKLVQTYTHRRTHSSSSTDPNPPTKNRKLG